MGDDLEISYEKQERLSFGSIVSCFLHDVILVKQKMSASKKGRSGEYLYALN